jgi:hypothetical protein
VHLCYLSTQLGINSPCSLTVDKTTSWARDWGKRGATCSRDPLVFHVSVRNTHFRYRAPQSIIPFVLTGVKLQLPRYSVQVTVPKAHAYTQLKGRLGGHSDRVGSMTVVTGFDSWQGHQSISSCVQTGSETHHDGGVLSLTQKRPKHAAHHSIPSNNKNGYSYSLHSTIRLQGVRLN